MTPPRRCSARSPSTRRRHTISQPSSSAISSPTSRRRRSSSRIAAVHVATGGSLVAVYRALLDAPEAWATPLAKFKTPWDWQVSALRAVGARAADARSVGALTALGQPIWRPGSPAGWDDIAASWAAPDALLRRVEVAQRLAAAVPTLDARTLGPRLMPGTWSPGTAAAVAKADSPAQGLAMLLVAPEFLRR